MKDAILIPYSCGAGAQDQRCADGPSALKKYDLVDKLRQHNIQSSWMKETPIDISDPSDRQLVVKQHCHYIKDTVIDIIEANKLPITIGGDHSSAVGTWSGVASALDIEKDLGVIWVDAHMDAHNHYTSPTGNMHGMPIAYLLKRACGVLSSITDSFAMLAPRDICLIGIRSFEEEEESLLKHLGVNIFSIEQIEKQGLTSVMQQAIEIVTQNNKYYGISIDIDAFDPSVAPGTGTKEENGILKEPFIDATKLAIAGHLDNLAAIEIAEYNPYLDQNNITADLIKDILIAILENK